MVRYLIVLIPFVLTCVPGYHIGKDLVIQSYDVFSIALIPFVLSKRKGCISIPKIRHILNIWKVFVAVVVISLMIVTFQYDGTSSSSYLKAFRLLYPIIISLFVIKNFDKFNDKLFFRMFLVSMLTCPLIGILGFKFQWDGFIAVQGTMFSEEYVYRAGSFWEDSSFFGLVCAVFSLISLMLLLQKNNSKQMSLFLTISLITNVMGIVYAFSRSGMLILVLGFFYLTYLYSKKNFTRVMVMLILALGGLVFLYFSETYPVLNQNIDLMLEVSTISSTNASDISSTRTDTWGKVIHGFFYRSPFLNQLIGYGYKTKNFAYTVDNGYIYTTISTGFIGIIVFFIFLKKLFFLKSRTENKYIKIYRILFYSFLIAMMFCDCLTYIPVNILIFLFMSIGLILDKNNKRRYENSNRLSINRK